MLLDEYDSKVTNNQKKYGSYIGFSITNSCPLNCEHCIVNANSYNEELISASDYHWYLLQLIKNNPELEEIVITGGEPFYRPNKLKVFSDFCYMHKINLAVVTSGYWASNYNRALATIIKYPGIGKYAISTDKYHIKHLSMNYIRNAYVAAKSLNKKVHIKITGETKNSLKKNNCLNEIFEFVKDENDLFFQCLMPIGRAKENCKNEFAYKSTPSNIIPCTSAAIFIKENGRVEPCCGILPFLKTEHHMALGNILYDDISAIFNNIKTNWLFNFIRLWGFNDLMNIIKDSELAEKLPDSFLKLKKEFLRDEVCSLCSSLFADQEISDYLYNISKDFDFRFKVALGMVYYFDDHEPLNYLFENYNIQNFIADK